MPLYFPLGTALWSKTMLIAPRFMGHNSVPFKETESITLKQLLIQTRRAWDILNCWVGQGSGSGCLSWMVIRHTLQAPGPRVMSLYITSSWYGVSSILHSQITLRFPANKDSATFSRSICVKTSPASDNGADRQWRKRGSAHKSTGKKTRVIPK